MLMNRRRLLAATGGAICLAGRPALARAAHPIGVQLWAVRDQLARDEDGTLRQLAKIGCRELELFELPANPAEFRRKCVNLGLQLVSGHFYLDALQRPATVDAAAALGLQYLVVVFPVPRALEGRDISSMSPVLARPVSDVISVDDYRWNADQFNQLAQSVSARGLRLGYHNHAIDLKPLAPGVSGMDTLLAQTDGNLVSFEMDTGHFLHAGTDPTAYIARHPGRFALVHMKDLQPGYTLSTAIDAEDTATNAELGAGALDWNAFVTAARSSGVRHFFIELEGAMRHEPMVALRNSYRYIRKFL
jgi:sugar phosphate isomerase/epimerase